MKSLICLSGLDGAGKTTQCKLLHEALLPTKPIYKTLDNSNITQMANRALIDFIKRSSLILNDNQIQVVKSAFYMRFHIQQLIQEYESRDEILILDRYIETIYAHAKLHGLSFDVIDEIFSEIYLKPDFYFFLDLDPNICYRRILQRGKVLEAHEKPENLTKLYSYYKSLVVKLGMELIDANKPPLKLHQCIIFRIKSLS